MLTVVPDPHPPSRPLPPTPQQMHQQPMAQRNSHMYKPSVGRLSTFFEYRVLGLDNVFFVYTGYYSTCLE